MKTIITSVLTSLTVSLITFILGLKSGKNQADRAFLQRMYKQLYAHFTELETALKEKRPKRWDDYKKIEYRNQIKCYPLVREMERTGDLIYINNKIAKQALQLELDCLNYKYNVDKLCLKVHDYLVKTPGLFIGLLSDATYNRNDTNSWRIVGTSNPLNCNTFRYITYDVLLDKDRLIKELESMDSNDSKCALKFFTRGNPPEREFTIYPNSLSDNNEVFADSISQFTAESMDCTKIEKELLNRIEVIKKQLAKKAKNPTGFWETFAGAFVDIFQ